ncbi:MAG TPA: MFS transporter [Burkholderiaceae bacterium]|nr:MFS transporter [Burkholderiaceae bacterium]
MKAAPAQAAHLPAAAAASELPGWMIFVMACACGMSIANIYYAQPLVNVISSAVGLASTLSSFIVTVTQAGYCVGLLALVPLGDLMESRRLILGTLTMASIALLLVAGAESVSSLLAACFLLGACSVAVQMIIPMATHLSSPSVRGRVVGSITSGLLVGVMSARPVAGLLSSAYGWRAVFVVCAAALASMTVALRIVLPEHRAGRKESYPALISSLPRLLQDTPVLRQRAACQAALFAAYSLFWTSVPFVLSGADFGLSQREIALFSTAAIAGAVAAPVAGRLADAGKADAAAGIGICLAAGSFAIAWLARDGSLALMIVGAVLLDIGVWSNLVLGQRTISMLAPAHRSRMNALYTSIFFAGGALGSGCASLAYASGGWQRVCLIGILFPLAALLFFGARARPSAAPL